MNKEQFTPGPWAAEWSNIGEQWSVYSGTAREPNWICSIIPDVKSTVEANANLIAAAPDTYHELKRLVNFLRENKIHVGTDGSLNIDLDNLIGHSIAALNKANP